MVRVRCSGKRAKELDKVTRERVEVRSVWDVPYEKEIVSVTTKDEQIMGSSV